MPNFLTNAFYNTAYVAQKLISGINHTVKQAGFSATTLLFLVTQLNLANAAAASDTAQTAEQPLISDEVFWGLYLPLLYTVALTHPRQLAEWIFQAGELFRQAPHFDARAADELPDAADQPQPGR